MKLTRRGFMNILGLSVPIALTKRVMSETKSLHFMKENRAPQIDTWIELNLQNMAWNLEKVRSRAQVLVMAVIKANAYGHGLVNVGRFLDNQGIDALMVCKLHEAIELRKAGVKCPILNFGPLFPEDAGILSKLDISQSVFTDEIYLLSQNATKLGRSVHVHIHIDTGMGRMGIPYYEALPYVDKVAKLKGICLQGISTTLTEETEFDKVQMERFLSLCQKAEEKGIRLGFKHAHSSAGFFTSESSYLDMVRPGILLYGYYPSEKTQEENLLSLKPVLQLKSRVASVKHLRPGDSVSYHRVYRASQKEKIAVIPVGYSDGYPFSVVGKGSVVIKGQRFPIIGAITANHLEVRLHLDSQVSVGDEAVLLGSQENEKIFAEELARWADVSTYKILINLNPLLPKM
ncbi:MAG: alanine racemase, partial [Candidatus Aminicenantes bacterium]|nr:alanine racemase [Candidatus Aminicenantes bacterium]